METLKFLKNRLSSQEFGKLSVLKNKEVFNFVAKYVKLCNPKSVFIRTDNPQDIQYIREKAIQLKEEIPLKIKGHTVHFDGIYDQARDKENTKFLVEKNNFLKGLNCIERKKGLEEIHTLLENIMQDKEVFVLFLCLGPVNSEFSIYAVQITDSSYVAHSEDILYRPAYEVFKKDPKIDFFKYVHSQGELDELNNSKNIDKRRIYIDFLENTVYSLNTQYAGNTLGLKKPSLRLAIRKADKEGWLAEHMFVMGINNKDKKRRTYFTGAFPSFCGKTSTCMVKGESIIGDDIAYLRKREGKVFAVNVERGIFGIIKDVNPQDDPLIWEALNKEEEVIFTNVLLKDGKVFWQGDGRPPPSRGRNFSGDWFEGKKNKEGKPIPFSHPNARYTIRLNTLANYDPETENPCGVLIRGIIYGGRDSDTWPPVFESLNWKHGVVTIASSLESETTSATLGKTGVRKFNLMANLDFLSIPIGKYIQNHLNFADDLKTVPVIFGVNYFLKDGKGNYLTGIQDKRVWLKWMEKRVYKEVEAIKTPIGFIPYYEDLKKLFEEVLSREYPKSKYLSCFSIRVNENLSKIERIKKIYQELDGIPDEVFKILEEQKERLEKAKEKFGEFINPEKFIL